MNGRFWLILIAIVYALLLGVSSCSSEPAALTSEQKRLNLESFDQVWTTVKDKHFDTTFGGVDWPAVRDELRPRMEQAATVAEARGILRDMLSRLGLSHFNIISAELYENIDGSAKTGDADGVTGLDARVIDNAALVTAVAEGTPAEAAGIRPGWEILAINGEDIPPLLPPIAEEYK
ncbi:MAG: PDZ domain-containing protein, partial [candidate division Zixibacteria bacterium]|nr:PDZ domain-containing protein [candidate division Zixibacteria bacterium]